MNGAVDILLVANAGILVGWNGSKLLVDGVHHEEGHPFSSVSETDLARMRQGKGCFANLDYLLFTHEHPDHFTPRLVLEYVRCRPVKGMFLPDAKDGSSELGHLVEHARRNGLPCQTLGLEPGETRRFSSDSQMDITAIGTRHMGPQYQHVRNDCLLLALGGMNLLFTGDADHVPRYYEQALADVRLDAVFVNPIFYHNPDGQNIIREIFRPRHLVVYHMPFAQDDSMRFGNMVRRDTERNRDSKITTHVLRREKQHIRLFSASW